MYYKVLMLTCVSLFSDIQRVAAIRIPMPINLPSSFLAFFSAFTTAAFPMFLNQFNPPSVPQAVLGFLFK
jgi:hypothetical protein